MKKHKIRAGVIFWPLVLAGLLCSCGRPSRAESAVEAVLPEPAPGPRPLAVLQAGEYPLWFQFSETGPVLLESIADAQLSAALVPWPLAAYVPGILAAGDELFMAVNRDGFLRFAPWPENGSPDRDGPAGLGLYRISGGEFWRQYTVGAFALVGEKPAALLYRDDRFLDSGAEVPGPRTWTWGPDSAEPEALAVPALDQFPPEEGWNVDTFRLGPDGFWYYRVLRLGDARPEIRLLRTVDPGLPGEAVSLGLFQNSALPEPLSAAPAPLGDLLKAAFTAAGGVSAEVVSPEFPQQRHFAGAGEDGPGLLVYYRDGPAGPYAVAILPDGRGVLVSLNAAAEQPQERHFTLPSLPEGFVYTGIAHAAGDVFCAAWEEQEEFNIGAAGFMVIKNPLEFAAQIP
jgi:hypothetical protein